MDRRRALKGFLLFGGGAAAVAAGFKSYQWYRKPDLQRLPDYRTLIAELAETIIPRTDTPGAKDAGVQDYIITMILDCTPTKLQNKFMNGLVDVQEYTQAQYGRSFLECSKEQRHN